MCVYVKCIFMKKKHRFLECLIRCPRKLLSFKEKCREKNLRSLRLLNIIQKVLDACRILVVCRVSVISYAQPTPSSERQKNFERQVLKLQVPSHVLCTTITILIQ